MIPEQGRPFCIGLTGGIGSGKTTACRLFSELGVPVLDADQIAHDLTRPGQSATRTIIKTFGEKIGSKDGGIDRTRLRQLIFNDPESKQKLEAILHPLIYAEIERRALSLKADYCIIAIPLLIETHAEHLVDRVLVIDASEATQLQRAGPRDSSDAASIIKIIKSQASREERLGRADDIIHNDGNIESLKAQVCNLHTVYTRLAIVHQRPAR